MWEIRAEQEVHTLMKINQELKNKFPWGAGKEWTERAKEIARMIPDDQSVLDLGGGFCGLERILGGKYMAYASIDIEEWTDLTTKADFNKGEFPDMGKFDWLVCQGVLEYMERPVEFLSKIQKYGKNLVISYNFNRNSLKKNDYTLNQLVRVFLQAGWQMQLVNKNIFKKSNQLIFHLYI